MKIRLLPVNPAVGALARNADRLAEAARAAAADGVEALLLPARALEGAPLLGLADRPDYLRARKAALAALSRRLPPGLPLFTTLSLDGDGGDKPVVLGRNLPPAARRVPAGLAYLPCRTALADDSPDGRRAALSRAAKKARRPLAAVNLLGGQDESVFDGAACLFAADGSLLAASPRFSGAPLDFDLPARGAPRPQPLPPPLSPEAACWAAITLGIRDYVGKNGAPGVLVALSGGMDSALVAALAVDALGPARVLGATFPSRYSTSGTHRDAHRLADALGIPCLDIPIAPAVETFSAMLAAPGAATDAFPVLPGSLEAENLQARIRGVLGMALANRHGLFMLETSNRSESLAGYCTLYGDTCGAYAPLASLYKTEVFALARWRNAQGPRPVIPRSIIARPPSAELRPGQRDSDSLPPYDHLDPALRLVADRNLGAAEAAAAGAFPDAARRALRLLFRSEYKRRQVAFGPQLAPPGPRLPATNAFLGDP